MRNVFAAGKKAHERPAFLRFVIANGSAKHWIFTFDCVDDRAHGCRTVKIDMYFISDARERAQMMRKNYSDHFSVCASTDSTAGRSRTIAFHESPASFDP